MDLCTQYTNFIQLPKLPTPRHHLYTLHGFIDLSAQYTNFVKLHKLPMSEHHLKTITHTHTQTHTHTHTHTGGEWGGGRVSSWQQAISGCKLYDAHLSTVSSPQKTFHCLWSQNDQPQTWKPAEERQSKGVYLSKSSCMNKDRIEVCTYLSTGIWRNARYKRVFAYSQQER